MLEVLAAGALTTVQDRGRPGWARYGVPPSGPVDAAAFAAANRLVGNSPAAAGLEITLAGPTLRALDDCLIAVCGAAFDLWVGRLPVPGWHSVYVRAGSVIRFGALRRGARACLAVSGGIQVPLFLGSRSTYLRGGFGGKEGRALQAGDRLLLGAGALRSPIEAAGVRWPSKRRPPYCSSPTLRVVLGPQDDHLSPAAVSRLLNADYVLSPAWDRMGARLMGPPLDFRKATGIVSDGVVTGSIQVVPDGQPIIALVDRQTTGGYPKVATVIGADLPLLAQCPPGATVRLAPVGIAEAQAALLAFRGGL